MAGLDVELGLGGVDLVVFLADVLVVDVRLSVGDNEKRITMADAEINVYHSKWPFDLLWQPLEPFGEEIIVLHMVKGTRFTGSQNFKVHSWAPFESLFEAIVKAFSRDSKSGLKAGSFYGFSRPPTLIFQFGQRIYGAKVSQVSLETLRNP